MNGISSSAASAAETRAPNSGCVLTADQADRVFDRFWRADAARSATGSHCGLGLALSRRIAQFLNGTIEVSVMEDRFTAVVGLPLAGLELGDQLDELLLPNSEPLTARSTVETA